LTGQSFDDLVSYAIYYKRYIMTKVYDPKLLGTNEDLENPNPYL